MKGFFIFRKQLSGCKPRLLFFSALVSWSKLTLGSFVLSCQPSVPKVENPLSHSLTPPGVFMDNSKKKPLFEELPGAPLMTLTQQTAESSNHRRRRRRRRSVNEADGRKEKPGAAAASAQPVNTSFQDASWVWHVCTLLSTFSDAYL